MPYRQLTILVLALLLFSGCQLWNPGGSTYADKDGRFHVDAPTGWQYATSLGPDFVASKDGVVLQEIYIEHRELAKALPNAKKPVAAGADAFQLAEDIVGDLKADRNTVAFDLTENAPATIGGKPGCKLSFTYQTPYKLRLAETMYACIADGKLWVLHYRAPERHYYGRDLATFEQVVKSFKFGKT